MINVNPTNSIEHAKGLCATGSTGGEAPTRSKRLRKLTGSFAPTNKLRSLNVV
jgi:hypothetical protein